MSSTPAVAVPLLASQRRQILRNDELSTAGGLNTAQTALEVGQSVPIVFGRRTGTSGGVWVSPPASECRFENDSANRVTASYLLVVSDGQLSTIGAFDAYQGDTPLISTEIAQAYDARAAGWAPGNFIQQRFNITTTSRREVLEGRAVGADSSGALDIGGLSTAELDQLIDDAAAVLQVESSGNYVTSFKVDVTKIPQWPATGTLKAVKGPYGSIAVLDGDGNSVSIGLPTVGYYEAEPWTIPADQTSGPTGPAGLYGPVIQVSGLTGWQLWFLAANSWIRDRAIAGRYLPTASYEVTRTASVEPYGDISYTITEQINRGFLLQQTASIVVYDGTYSTSIYGGLPAVTYDVTIEETNSEPLARPQATIYCGTGGSYEGLTTFSVVKQYPAGDEGYLRQVHLFVREGRTVDRLIEGSTGTSNLFPDLVRYLLQASARVPADLIDTTALIAAARFNRTNDLTFDGIVANPTNVREYIDRVAPLFLLRPTDRWGKLGLRPAVPVTAGHEIDTAPLSPLLVFDETNILTGSFRFEYVPSAERQEFAMLAIWREQPENDLGVLRTTEVRYQGTAVDGPYEELDGSEMITRELHAIRAAALQLSKRRHVTHRATFQVAPSAAIAALRAGDIVRVNRSRNPSLGAASLWSYLYELDRISGPPLGPWTLEVTHHPVDADGRSLLALDVAAASVA